MKSKYGVTYETSTHTLSVAGDAEWISLTQDI